MYMIIFKNYCIIIIIIGRKNTDIQDSDSSQTHRLTPVNVEMTFCPHDKLLACEQCSSLNAAASPLRP